MLEFIDFNETKIISKDEEIKEVKYEVIDKDIPHFKIGSSESAGIDMYAIKDTWIFPFRVTKVPVNLKVQLQKGMLGLMTSRSGMSLKGVFCVPGIIDSDYRGDLSAIVTKIGILPRKIKKGERVAQLIITNHYNYVGLSPVDKLEATTRGANGFGSTGIN